MYAVCSLYVAVAIMEVACEGALLITLALAILTGLGIGDLGAFNCPTEDSSWCYWDAQRMGNTSFITLWQH